jgi:hypothetical protein
MRALAGSAADRLRHGSMKLPRHVLTCLASAACVLAAAGAAGAQSLPNVQAPVPTPSVPTPSLPKTTPVPLPHLPTAPNTPSVPNTPSLPAAPGGGTTPALPSPVGGGGGSGGGGGGGSGTGAGGPAGAGGGALNPGGGSSGGDNGAAGPAGRERSPASERRFQRDVERLRDCFSAVTPFERRVLGVRAGLVGRSGRSRASTARRLKTSPGRVTRAERRGLRGLRRASRSGACANRGYAVGNAIADGGVVAGLGSTGELQTAEQRSGADRGAVQGVSESSDSSDGTAAPVGSLTPASEGEIDTGGLSVLAMLWLTLLLVLAAAVLLLLRRRSAEAQPAPRPSAAVAASAAHDPSGNGQPEQSNGRPQGNGRRWDLPPAPWSRSNGDRMGDRTHDRD